MKILDSDHCIAILRGQLNLAERVAPTEELAVTAISVGELAHGAHKSARVAENLARLDVLLATVTVLPFDERTARRFGRLKTDLERAGTIIGDLDLQIASIAIENSFPLVTNNTQHFKRVDGLQLLNWME